MQFRKGKSGKFNFLKVQEIIRKFQFFCCVNPDQQIGFQEASEFVHSVNDLAERGIKLIEDFAGITKMRIN